MSKKIQNTILKLNLVKDRDSVSLPFAENASDVWRRSLVDCRMARSLPLVAAARASFWGHLCQHLDVGCLSIQLEPRTTWSSWSQYDVHMRGSHAARQVQDRNPPPDS